MAEGRIAVVVKLFCFPFLLRDLDIHKALQLCDGSLHSTAASRVSRVSAAVRSLLVPEGMIGIDYCRTWRHRGA